jgi:hypothetical protein
VYRTYQQSITALGKYIKAVETQYNMKPISRSQCPKSGSTKASGQCLLISRYHDWELKLSSLMICSVVSDGATNVYPGRGPEAATANEAGRNPK